MKHFLSLTGFTLIETIMAMTILVVGVIGVVRLLPTGIGASHSSEMISKAAFLAQEKIEELKLVDFDELIDGTVDLEGESGEYSWDVELSEISLDGLVNSDSLRQLTMKIGWQEKARSRSETFVTYIRE